MCFTFDKIFVLKKIIGIVLGLGALALIAKGMAAKKMGFNVKNVFIKKNAGKYQLYCLVSIENPTKESITIEGLNFNFLYQNKIIGSTVYNTKTVFAPNKNTDVALPISGINGAALLTIIAAYLKGDKLTFTVKGTVNFSGVNIPIEKEISLL